MSRVYCVSYDATYPTTALLESLASELTKFDGWCHYIDDTWLVRTALNARDIYARLRPHIDKTVNLLVIEVGSDCAGRLPREAWEWIEQNTRPRMAGGEIAVVESSPIAEGSVTP